MSEEVGMSKTGTSDLESNDGNWWLWEGRLEKDQGRGDFLI